MKDSTWDFVNKLLAGALFIVALFAAFDANAWTPRQKQYQKQELGQEQTASAVATNEAISEGGSVTMNSRGGNDTVFIPNNNTESCLRVFGIAVPTKDGAAVLGLPWRSGPCDLEASADDAFAQGNVALGWAFKCKMKSNRKAFGGEQACLDKATETIDVMNELAALREAYRALNEERDADNRACEESKNRVRGELVECLQK